MSQDDDGCIMFDTYPDDLKKEVEIYLDLNGYKIISDGTTHPSGGAKGILSIYSRNSILYIDDNSEEANGGVEYTGPTDQAYRLVTCCYGGQVVINRGNFVSTSISELVWIYEQESQHAMAEIKALNAIGITPDNSKEYSEKPTDEETLKKYNDVIKKLTSTGTINGGWFKGGFTGSSVDEENVLVNTYNVRREKWNQYCDYAHNKGYPKWTQWGTYVNQTFSYVHINGGSFVNLNPSRGDNIVGNRPEKWVNDKHSIVKETVNGQTVYTVVPNDSPEYYPRATGHN